jgi:hypothetical protein
MLTFALIRRLDGSQHEDDVAVMRNRGKYRSFYLEEQVEEPRFPKGRSRCPAYLNPVRTNIGPIAEVSGKRAVCRSLPRRSLAVSQPRLGGGSGRERARKA